MSFISVSVCACSKHLLVSTSILCIQATRKEQAAALLEVLLRKDNRAYISFYNALVRESYGDLASLLHPDLPLASPEGEKSFSDGGTTLGKRALIVTVSLGIGKETLKY